MDRGKNEKPAKSGFAGGVAGAVTRFICQPFDVLKIRLQLQVEPIRHENTASKYRSLYQTVRVIYREEGLLAFWKGHNPAQILSITYGVAQFGFYDRLNNFLRDNDYFEHHPKTRNFLCGAISGCFASFVINPIDVVRTRLISQDPGRGYKNSLHGLQRLWFEEGMRGMYRGIWPAIWQIAPNAGGQFMMYNVFGGMFREFEHRYHNLGDHDVLPAYELLICGGLAGITTKLAVYPLDLAKKRLQIQGFATNRTTFGKHFICNDAFNCLAKTAAHEGIKGLYKGLYPALLKAGVTTAFYFALYDEIVAILK